MNRDIKFRVWDGGCFRGNLKQYFLNLSNGEISVVAYSDLYDEYYEANERGESLIIQQYTGLKDKNGKEIYEGDIVQVHSEQYINENYVGTIIFDEGSFLTKISDNDIRGVFSGEDQDIVVIGNIFENPELLKA